MVVFRIRYLWWIRVRPPGALHPVAIAVSEAGGRLSRLPPPHRLTDPIGGPAPPPAARGPLSIFRKIHSYGKTKRSTHGHREPSAATRGTRRSREKHRRGPGPAGAPGRQCRLPAPPRAVRGTG